MVKSSYTKSMYELQKGIGVGFEVRGINEGRLEKLLSTPWTSDGKTFRDRCWEGKTELIGGIQSSLVQGLLRGDSSRKITDAIAKKFGVSKYKAGRLVHTETTYFNAIANKESYKELGVDSVEVIETLDTHTCEICGGFDGKVIPIEYVQGLETCYVEELLVPGEDEEDTETFRKRYFDSLNSTAFGGNQAGLPWKNQRDSRRRWGKNLPCVEH